MKHTQYTIRNVPSALDAKLRAKALREKKSLNHLLVEQLEHSLEKSERPRSSNDYDDLVGSWLPDPDFDAALQDMRIIDPRDWS